MQNRKGVSVQMQKMVSVVGMSDEEVGFLLLKRCVLVHLEDCDDKFSLLLLMLRKLWSFASGECAADNADALSSQEILLSGHLYLKDFERTTRERSRETSCGYRS